MKIPFLYTIQKENSTLPSEFQQNNFYKFQINLIRESYTFIFDDDFKDEIFHYWWYQTNAPEKVGINGELSIV